MFQYMLDTNFFFFTLFCKYILFIKHFSQIGYRSQSVSVSASQSSTLEALWYYTFCPKSYILSLNQDTRVRLSFTPNNCILVTSILIKYVIILQFSFLMS